MKELTDKRKNIEERPFGDAKELLDELCRRSGRWGSYPDEWVFRGQADSDWGLAPSSLRGENRRLNKGQLYEEISSVYEFARMADRSGLLIPGGAATVLDIMSDDCNIGPRRIRELKEFPRKETLELFALAQHHGVPTRLLDWSNSPMTSAYFAAVGVLAEVESDIEAAKTKEMAIYCLNTYLVNANQWNRERRVRFVTPPRAHNANLNAQEGVFTVVDKKILAHEKPLLETVDDIVESLEIEEGEIPMKKMTLPWSECTHLLDYLRYEGVTAAKLFPGYDGVVRANKERERAEKLRKRINERG